MEITTRATMAFGTGKDSALTLWGELLRRAWEAEEPGEGTTHIELFAGSSSEACAAIADPVLRDMEAAFLARCERLPKVNWAPKTRRLKIAIRSALGPRGSVASVGPTEVQALARELSEALVALAPTLRSKAGVVADGLVRAARQLPSLVPMDEDGFIALSRELLERRKRPAKRAATKTPRDKPIIDIGANTKLPELDPLVHDARWVCDRLCRKLREYGFSLGGKVDHLVVRLTADEPRGRTAVERHADWVYVEVSIEPAVAVGASTEELAAHLADAVCIGLAAVRADDAAACALIDRARAELAAAGRDLAVVYFTKETRQYVVRVLHQMARPRAGPVVPIRPKATFYATLEYRDLRTGFVGRAKLMDFIGYEQIHSAVGSVTVKDGVIVVKPRPGDHHGVPIEVPLASLTAFSEP